MQMKTYWCPSEQDITYTSAHSNTHTLSIATKHFTVSLFNALTPRQQPFDKLHQWHISIVWHPTVTKKLYQFNTLSQQRWHGSNKSKTSELHKRTDCWWAECGRVWVHHRPSTSLCSKTQHRLVLWWSPSLTLCLVSYYWWTKAIQEVQASKNSYTGLNKQL